MALKYFYNDIPHTAAYIDSLNADRAAHHNYCIEQYHYLQSRKPVAQMNEAELQEFDEQCLIYLICLDRNLEFHQTTTGETLVLQTGEIIAVLANEEEFLSYKTFLIEKLYE